MGFTWCTGNWDRRLLTCNPLQEDNWQSPNPIQSPKLHVIHSAKLSHQQWSVPFYPQGPPGLSQEHFNSLYLACCWAHYPLIHTQAERLSSSKRIWERSRAFTGATQLRPDKLSHNLDPPLLCEHGRRKGGLRGVELNMETNMKINCKYTRLRSCDLELEHKERHSWKSRGWKLLWQDLLACELIKRRTHSQNTTEDSSLQDYVVKMRLRQNEAGSLIALYFKLYSNAIFGLTAWMVLHFGNKITAKKAVFVENNSVQSNMMNVPDKQWIENTGQWSFSTNRHKKGLFHNEQVRRAA